MTVPVDSTTSFRADSEEDDVTNDDHGRRWWPFVVAGLVALAGLSLLFPAGRHDWAVSFIRQPTRDTALFFPKAGNLPTEVKVGTPIHLSFTIVNNEGKRIQYRYVLSSGNVTSGHAGTVLRRATLTVAGGGTRTASVDVVPVCPSSSCRLQVSLPGYPETIDVLLSVHHPAA